MDNLENNLSAINRIEDVLKEKGMKNPEFQRKLGISSQNWNNWKNRGLPPRMIFPIAALLGLNIDYIVSGKGEKYTRNIQEANAGYQQKPSPSEIIHVEQLSVLEEAAWKTLPPQIRAFVEDVLNKFIGGQLTLEHIKILHNMADALSKN